METLKTIYVIHAADADQHLGHLRKILDELKNERRIQNYTTLESETVTENSFGAIGDEDMVIMLLTHGIEPVKAEIETILFTAKTRKPDAKMAQVIVDHLAYETKFIAFPADLEPIRSREDMDSVWNKIGQSLRDIFPADKIPVPVEKKTTNWKKYLPFILGLLGVLILFFVVRGFMSDDEVDPEIPPGDFKVTEVKAALTTPAAFEGDCPHQFDFQGVIEANGAGEVAYTWIKNDGTTGSVETVDFEEAGSKTVQASWSLGAANSKQDGWQQLKVITPNEMESNQATFKLICKTEDTTSPPPPPPGEEKPKADIRVTSVTPQRNATLDQGERVTFKYTYKTDAPDGIRIFGRPMTKGKVSPNYAAHGASILSKGSGTGSGYFTIKSVGRAGANVDQIRFQIWDADQKNLLKESFFQVNYNYVSQKLDEDCLSFDYKKVKVQKAGTKWRVTDGRSSMMTFRTQAKAQMAVNLIKRYRMTAQCFAVRPKAGLRYFKVGDNLPSGSASGEDCNKIKNPKGLTIRKNNNNSYSILDGNSIPYSAKSLAEAQKIVALVKQYQPKYTCYVERPNPGMVYLRK